MISVYLQGQFGNHLFLYVIARIIALHKQTNFHIPRNFYPLSMFPNIDLGIEPEIYEYSFWGNEEQKYTPELFNIPDNTRLIGQFQTDKYFIGYEHLIKEWLFDPLVPNNIPDNICYMHFRGTDYSEKKWILPKEYYDAAKTEMLKHNENLIFKIITDDPELAGQIFDEEIIHSDYLNAFRLLRGSRYLIIGNSTFSWWAAWLNENCSKIIAPQRWLNFSNATSDWFPYDIKTDKFVWVDNLNN